MINVNMTDKAGVTLATAGKYCADNVKVTPSADILRKDEQAKTATPTTSAQDITPDAGKALSKVTVNPITSAIVGNLDADSFASAIVSAIEGKGVDVPSGAKLDALAALIESIQAGGIAPDIVSVFNALDASWKLSQIIDISAAQTVGSTYTINIGATFTNVMIVWLAEKTLADYGLLFYEYHNGRANNIAVVYKPSTGTQYQHGANYITNPQVSGTDFSFTMSHNNAKLNKGKYLVFYQ